jgi:hypothetical protein
VKLDVHFSLEQLVQVLRTAAQTRYPDDEIGVVSIDSYDQTRIAITMRSDTEAMVECDKFRHVARGVLDETDFKKVTG